MYFGNRDQSFEGFVSRLWMGHPTDNFKDVQEVEVLSYTKFQKKFCGEAFFEMSSFKTLNIIEIMGIQHIIEIMGIQHIIKIMGI